MLPEKVKKKKNTSLSPPPDLLSWRTMAITNAFSCSSRNTSSAKGLSQLLAGYCKGWFPPAELHWCSCSQRAGFSWLHKLAEGNHFVPLQWFENTQTWQGTAIWISFIQSQLQWTRPTYALYKLQFDEQFTHSRSGRPTCVLCTQRWTLQAALMCVQVLVLAMHLSNQNLVKSLLQWSMPQSYKTCFSFQINLWFIFSKACSINDQLPTDSRTEPWAR